MESDILYKNKYLKYKTKYNELKKSRNIDQSGGFLDFLKKKMSKPKSPQKPGIHNLAKLGKNKKPLEPNCKCECPNKPDEEQAAESADSEVASNNTNESAPKEEVVNETSAYEEVVDEQSTAE